MIYVDLLETNYQEIITTFSLNTMLHNVGMIWTIENHEYLKYDMDILSSDLLIGGTWYNTYICKRLHGKLFEEFIISLRTDRYNIMFYIDAYEREHQSSTYDDGSIGGGCPLSITSTNKSLQYLGATIDFIGFWLKSLEHNFLEICNLYTHFMVELF